MSTPNPLIPQGSLHHKAGRSNSNVRIAVATIVGIHVVFFGGLLLQGCKREVKVAEAPETETNASPFAGLSYPEMTNTSSLYYESESSLPTDQTNLAGTTPQGGPTTASGTGPGTGTGYQPLFPGTSTQATRYTTPSTSGFGAPPPVSEPEMKEYTVVRGDSFYKIAKDHNTTIKALTEANPNIEPAKLQVGAKIKVPVGAPAGSSSSSAASTPGSTSSGNGTVYTVKSGDTLTRIAQRHGTTVSALRSANGLRTSRLLVGQKLKIPTNGGTNGNGTAPNL